MSETVEAGDTKPCPFCAETIKAAAIVCRYCGRELTTQDVSFTQRPMWAEPPPLPEPQKSRRSGCMRAIIAVAVLIGAALLFGMFFPSRNSTTVTRAATATPRGATPMPTLTAVQLQERATSIPFDDLARNTEKHEGKNINLAGEVIQVIEDGDGAQLRINVDGDSGQTVFVQYPGYGKARVLEGDTVKMVALVDGRITYEAVLGNEVSLPLLTALWLEVQPAE